MEDLSFIPSGRGGKKALHKGFTYTKHRENSVGSVWHCVARHSNCKGRLKINSREDTAVLVKSHNHLPDFGQAKASKLVAAAKKRCLDEPNVLPSVVTRDTYANADLETLAALPKEASVKQALRRLRREDLPRLPASLDELENIPAKYTTVDDER